MKVKMNSLVLQFSSKEVEDSSRNSIIRKGIWSELEAVEIRTWQVVQLSTILFNEIAVRSDAQVFRVPVKGVPHNQ